MRLSRLFCVSLVLATVLTVSSSRSASAEDCNCLAVAGDVAAAIQAEVAKADNLYMRGDFAAAATIYVNAYATSKDASLLFAQGMAFWQLGDKVKAKGAFQAYLAVKGELAYRARAEAAIAALGGAGGGVVAGTVGGVGRLGGGLVGGATGAVGGVGGAAVGGVETGVNAGVSGVGDLRGKVEGKAKIGRKAGIVLGVIAIAAIGVVGIHSIAAGVSADIELDPKFDLGLGVTGVAVGITAIYVGGLTAATGAVGATCITSLPARKPIVAPYATNGGGGLAAAMTF